MNAMILAAGKGERMRPLTLTTPKPLLHAGGKPLIGYHLENLRHAGVEKVVINHSWLGEQIEQTLDDGRDYGVSLVYSAEPEPLETAGGIRQALELLAPEGQDWFMVINGDVWTDFDLAILVPPEDPACRAVLVLVPNPPQHQEGDFTLTEDGYVVADGGDRLTFAGISLLHRELFAGLAPGYRRLAPVLTEAMASNRVKGLYHTGVWSDIGTPERLGALDRYLCEKEGR